jgi:Co/Zn/Cd efflux system component
MVSLTVDLGRRELQVVHTGPVDRITARLQPLGLGARLVSSTATAGTMASAARPSPERERCTLRWLLGLNGIMFGVELVLGWRAQSTGLIADSLDMFADAAVYGSALYAVGRSGSDQLRAARLSGALQLLLALGALSEVLRRAWLGSAPEPPLMMSVALLALVVNMTCLALLARHREGGVHLRASWIFSTNDVIANLGVILAGALVAWTGSNIPDLIIGTLIALIVLNGARRILRLRA